MRRLELYDGVLQNLAGVAFQLEALAVRLPHHAADLSGSARACRDSIRVLQTLLVDAPDDRAQENLDVSGAGERAAWFPRPAR